MKANAGKGSMKSKEERERIRWIEGEKERRKPGKVVRMKELKD